MKILKQNLNHRTGALALAILGTEQEIEQELTALYNWGVWGRMKASEMDTRAEAEDTPSRPIDGVAIVYSNEKRLRRGLLGRTENKLLMDESLCRQFKGKPGGIRSLACAELERTLAGIQDRCFLVNGFEEDKLPPPLPPGEDWSKD